MRRGRSRGDRLAGTGDDRRAQAAGREGGGPGPHPGVRGVGRRPPGRGRLRDVGRGRLPRWHGPGGRGVRDLGGEDHRGGGPGDQGDDEAHEPARPQPEGGAGVHRLHEAIAVGRGGSVPVEDDRHLVHVRRRAGDGRRHAGGAPRAQERRSARAGAAHQRAQQARQHDQHAEAECHQAHDLAGRVGHVPVGEPHDRRRELLLAGVPRRVDGGRIAECGDDHRRRRRSRQSRTQRHAPSLYPIPRSGATHHAAQAAKRGALPAGAVGDVLGPALAVPPAEARALRVGVPARRDHGRSARVTRIRRDVRGREGGDPRAFDLPIGWRPPCVRSPAGAPAG